MLHWLYILNYLTFCTLISLFILNKSYFTLLLLSEVILVFLFSISLIIGSVFNIYAVLMFSFFILILGSLELTLNLLLFLI